MVQTVKIQRILTDMLSGFTFRSKVENDPAGDVSVIQMKDLQNNYSSVNNSTLIRINSATISGKSLLQKGDVLFIAKGSNNYAVEYTLELKAIAVSAFFILRPDKEKILPSYLVWYINQEPVQQYLKGNMAGTYIPNVNKATIENIEIRLPSIEVQSKIVVIDSLKTREYLLVSEIMRKREMVVSRALHHLINN